MADIFLSYAREDKGAAHRLADALQAGGWSVWWDCEIRPGETWDQKIEHELVAARCVRVEASEALRRRILIPVLMDAVEPPLAFRMIQAASLLDWRGEQDHPGFK